MDVMSPCDITVIFVGAGTLKKCFDGMLRHQNGIK